MASQHMLIVMHKLPFSSTASLTNGGVNGFSNTTNQFNIKKIYSGAMSEFPV